MSYQLNVWKRSAALWVKKNFQPYERASRLKTTVRKAGNSIPESRWMVEQNRVPQNILYTEGWEQNGELVFQQGRETVLSLQFLFSKCVFVSITVVSEEKTYSTPSLLTVQSLSWPFPHLTNFVCRIFDFSVSVLKLISAAQEDGISMLLEMFVLIYWTELLKLKEISGQL